MRPALQLASAGSPEHLEFGRRPIRTTCLLANANVVCSFRCQLRSMPAQNVASVESGKAPTRTTQTDQKWRGRQVRG